MYIFLASYILLIIPLLNKRFGKGIIYSSSILFIVFIIFSRETMAADDAFKYIAVIEGKEVYMRNISPIFGLLSDFFHNFIGLDALTTIQVISLVPIICVFISTMIVDLPILLPIFLSSETFVLLSFNGIRQGLSIGFLILALSVLIKGVLESENKITLDKFFLVTLFVICAVTSHGASFIYIASASIIFIANKFKYTFQTFKIKKGLLILSILSLIILTSAIILAKSLFLGLFTRVSNTFFSLDLSYIIQTGDGFGQSHLNAIYRFTILSIIILYTLIRTSNYEVNEKTKRALKLLYVSFLPIILFTFPLPAYILSRFSHFYVVPIFLSIYFLNKVLGQNQFIIYTIISFSGLIAYSSNSVITNLIYK